MVKFKKTTLPMTLPLGSLEWEFWNQSIHKTLSENGSEVEFENHINLWKNNILYLTKKENISFETIKNHLNKFWNEAVAKKYVDMHVKTRRFERFKNKISNNKTK